MSFESLQCDSLLLAIVWYTSHDIGRANDVVCSIRRARRSASSTAIKRVRDAAMAAAAAATADVSVGGGGGGDALCISMSQ